MYRTERKRILQEHPFRIQFQGERAIDFGGVAREMFSIFYECVYQNLFDGSALLSPCSGESRDGYICSECSGCNTITCIYVTGPGKTGLIYM